MDQDQMIAKKILKFESFINETLKGDLAELEAKLDSKTTNVAEFIQLRTIINTFKNIKADQNGFKTKLDLGNSFFVQAQIEDASNIMLDVGLGHFVEFTLDEALHIINIRVKLFQMQIDNLRKQIAQTNAYIKLTLLALQELQGTNITNDYMEK